MFRGIVKRLFPEMPPAAARLLLAYVFALFCGFFSSGSRARVGGAEMVTGAGGGGACTGSGSGGNWATGRGRPPKHIDYSFFAKTFSFCSLYI